MDNNKRMAEISEVQAKYVEELMLVPHVVGVGIGMRQRNGEYTDEMCLVVMVDEKMPIAQLDAESILPTELEGVGIDVQETGDFSA
jgi:hypothetical protein